MMAKRKICTPDPEGKNDGRALWAEGALIEYRQQTGADLEDAVSDLLADLMHWCDRNEFDFSRELDRARGHYAFETLS